MNYQKIKAALVLSAMIAYAGGTSQPIVANHQTCVLEEIPVEWINQAKTNFKIYYGHTSHGSQITTGMDNLQSHYGAPYTYNTGGIGGALSYQEVYGDLGHNGDLTWEQTTRQQLNSPSNNRNVVIWSWCGGVSDNTTQGIAIYLNAMNQLELDFPNVMFVYMTGHRDIWADANLKARNQQIRDYCIANNKILFDFADIESYNPDGDYFLYANDDCSYYEGAGWGYLGNWATEWCSSHPGSDLCWNCSCAHSQSLNCNLKGRAFWWMLAKMAGWDTQQNLFFVDKNHPDADDTNPGTIDLPWRTIQKAFNTVQAGDSVVIRQGTYFENLITQNHGNPEEGFIVFAAYPDEQVIVDGTHVNNHTGLRIQHSYMKLYGLELSNWDSTGIWILNSAFFELHSCKVHGVYFGIGISGNSHDFVISNTEVFDFTLYGIDASPMNEDFCYNGTFINCSSHSGSDPVQNTDGFALGHGVQHNFLFQNCTTYDVYDGFDISSSATILENCLAFDCWNTSYKLWQDNIEMVNCIGYNGGVSIVQLGWLGVPTKTIIRNCTFYDAAVYTIWQANSSDTLHIFNTIISGGENIGLCFEQPSAANYHGDFNLFQNNNPARAINVGGSNEFSLTDIDNGAWTAFSGEDANSIIAALPEEIYFDALLHDLHLKGGSPAINHASTVWSPPFDFEGTSRPIGIAPDIGAYEHPSGLMSYEVSPESLNFGIVVTGQTGQKNVIISNTGDIPAVIDSIGLNNFPFELQSLTFPLIIENTFSFEVTFNPQLPQSYEGEMTIYSSQSFNSIIHLSGQAINEPSGGFHVSGNVSGLWQCYDSIFVDGNIIVPSGETLTVVTVQGGTDFIFTGHYKFIVYGQLQLLGTSEDSIRLWSMNINEGWFGLRFYDLNYGGMDSSRVEYCHFRHGKAIGDDWDNFGGGIFIYESSPVTIRDCSIEHCQAEQAGGGMHIRYSSPDMKRLQIMHNTAGIGGGIHFNGSYSLINYAQICNNSADQGGGVYICGSAPVFDHTTVTDNNAAQGGGAYLINWSYPGLTNSILSGNANDEVFVFYDEGALMAGYSNIGRTEIYPGAGNINTDPLFTDPENGDFSLSWVNYPENDATKSPCIDSGNPLFPLDPDGSVTDMGANGFQAYQQTILIPMGWSSISTYLNPFNDDIEQMFADVQDELVIIQNDSGIYWPGQNINTLGNWNYHHGYLLKANAPLNVLTYGSRSLNEAIMLNDGWNLIPVLSTCEIDCQAIHEQLSTTLKIIKEPAGLLVFWPEMGITSLEVLQPGKSYFIFVNSASNLLFPQCIPK